MSSAAKVEKTYNIKLKVTKERYEFCIITIEFIVNAREGSYFIDSENNYVPIPYSNLTNVMNAFCNVSKQRAFTYNNIEYGPINGLHFDSDYDSLTSAGIIFYVI